MNRILWILARPYTDANASRRMLVGSSPATRGRGTARSAVERAKECYAHIAAFLRGAQEAQKHKLFQAIAREAGQMLATAARRFWISTSGLGVPWVHVRLDSGVRVCRLTLSHIRYTH